MESCSKRVTYCLIVHSSATVAVRACKVGSLELIDINFRPLVRVILSPNCRKYRR